MTLFFISDTHFNHENVIKYEDRPFANAAEMNEALIRNWNEVVQPDDTVIHCGDFALGTNKDNIVDIVNSLNGKIRLVRGNHDSPAKLEIYKAMPHKIISIDNMLVLDHKAFPADISKSRKIIVCHYPIVPKMLENMTADNPEIVFVHGHVHSKMPMYNPYYHSFNVSCDVTDYAPICWDGMRSLTHIPQDDDIFKYTHWQKDPGDQQDRRTCPYCNMNFPTRYELYAYCPNCGNRVG